MRWLRGVALKNTKALGCQPATALPTKESLAKSSLRMVSQQGVGVPLVSCGERAEMPLKYLQLPASKAYLDKRSQIRVRVIAMLWLTFLCFSGRTEMEALVILPILKKKLAFLSGTCPELP